MKAGSEHEPSALSILRRVFGYQAFRPNQAEIIATVVDGGDALVVMPTGGGKSLCFQIPALLRSGTGVVVSPLIALMQDQVSALDQVGIRAAFLNSTLSLPEKVAVERAFTRGELDLLYVAPERLTSPGFLDFLRASQIALFAIDEVHCVSQWGHDFRPDYLELAVLKAAFPEVPRIALTATADAPTRADILSNLHLQSARQFITGFNRPNIAYQVSLKNNPKQQLLNFVREQSPEDAGIVYCLSRAKVEATADFLCDAGRRALPYHAGLDATVRAKHQNCFLNEDGIIIVATIAFGMGIDKPDVRFVAHFDLPKSIEAYYQETGRAGRDGLPAVAWMTYGLQDIVALRQFIESSEASETVKRIERAKLNALLGYCETTQCRRKVLLNYFGEEFEAPCNCCDVCQTGVETWDGTIAAQKALSCVFRTGQRFGVTYLIEVLRGTTNDRIKRFGHEALSTFGVGTEHSLREWQSIFRQLIAAGYLTVDVTGYGGLRLTPESRGILQGDQPVLLRRDILEGNRPVKRKRTDRASDALSNDFERRVFEALRELRREIAQAQKVPPYVVFHDRSLLQMAVEQPETPDALAKVSGVGQKKLEKYGSQVLALLERLRTD